MRLIFLLSIFLISSHVSAQDERYFKKLFSGELINKKRVTKSKHYKYQVISPMYQFDMDGDDKKESFVFEARDGASLLHVHNYNEKRIFSFKFDVNGYDAKAYRIQVRKLSSRESIFVIYFHEGVTKFTDLNSTVRLYFLTIEDNDLSTLSMHKGPIFWEEKRIQQGHYHRRGKELSFIDFDKDGRKDLVLQYGQRSSVFVFKGKGRWLSL